MLKLVVVAAAASLVTSCSGPPDADGIAECLGGATPSRPAAGATPTPMRPDVSLRDLADPAIEAVSANAGSFGGAFMNRSHTALCVLHTVPEDQAKSLIEPHVAAGLPIVWIRVQYSSAELERVQSEIVQLWHAAGVQKINSVSVAVEANRVVVSLPARQPDLELQLRQHYGDVVVIEIEPPDKPAAGKVHVPIL